MKRILTIMAAAMLLWGCEGAQEIPPQEPLFELPENSVEIDAEGGTILVAVDANVEYECTSTADWVFEVEVEKADANTYVHTFEVEANPTEEQRSATLSFCGNSVCIPYTVTQAGAEVEHSLSVDAENFSVEYTGTETPLTVNVQSDVEWTVESDADWCVVTPTSGSGNGSFTISMSENAEFEVRACQVTVSSSEVEKACVISVAQAAQPREADPDWQSYEFTHRSLFLRFTATWCGYCPWMADAVDLVLEKKPGLIEPLSVHGGGSNLETEASSTLVSHYKISSFPTGLVDGYYSVGNYSQTIYTASEIIAGATQTADKYDVHTGLSWRSSVSGSNAVLDLNVYAKKAGDYKITVLLIEDGIIMSQNGGGANYEHNGVVQAAFTSPLGDDFTVTEDNQVKNFAYSVAIPTKSNPDNIKVVAYVQRTEGKVTFVDNATSAKVGEMRTLSLVK